MIEFKCPECGKLNEVSDRKAGMEVRCLRCDEWIDVPDRERKKKRKAEAEKPVRVRDRLSQEEYILYGVLFLVFPIINVWVSSFMYYAWRSTLPTKAYQINQLGWGIFLVQCVPMCACCCLGFFAGPPQQNRRFR